MQTIEKSATLADSAGVMHAETAHRTAVEVGAMTWMAQFLTGVRQTAAIAAMEVSQAAQRASRRVSDAQRLRDAIKEHGSLYARELNKITGVPVSSVSSLLKHDIKANRIERRDGRYGFLGANAAHQAATAASQPDLLSAAGSQ